MSCQFSTKNMYEKDVLHICALRNFIVNLIKSYRNGEKNFFCICLRTFRINFRVGPIYRY